ncbi:MAG: acetolactate synthase small subunit, partial [Lachnospiraceae bacterium]|nr:acetolactate synthase small subunit [Lachnospiraceae bacterium]
RQEILNAANVFRAKVVDYSPHSMMLEITGTGDKINALVEILKDYGLLEIARTGIVAVERGGNDRD